MDNLSTEVPVVNPLENALEKLDLQGTLVLLNVLAQRALMLQQSLGKPKILKGVLNASPV